MKKLILLSILFLYSNILNATEQKISIDTKGAMSFRMKENIMIFNEKPLMRNGKQTFVKLVDGKNTIICDTLTIRLKPGTSYGKEFDENSVKEITVTGNVSVKNDTVLIHANKGIYSLEPTPLITFVGKPASVSRDGSIIKSSRIRYYKEEDRIEIDPDGTIEIQNTK